MKVLSVFGTRPEAIKMAPVVQALAAHPEIESKVCVTAQHREMLDQVLQLFDIHPDYDLDLMRHGQTLTSITAAVLEGLDPILTEDKPDLLLVHGDTTTTFAASLAAYYHQVAVGHVEAGLRSGDKYAPYPEEINRMLTGRISDINFSPTQTAADNLLRENVAADTIHITGNTVIDALLSAVERPCDLAEYGLADMEWDKKVILLTCHRRENWGEPMRQIFRAIHDVMLEHPDCRLVYPLHKNPLVRELAHAGLDDLPGVTFIEPLDYLPFCHLMQRSHLILTDSGGMQEEAPALGKPVLVLREVTERPEALAAGTAALAGNTYESVSAAFRRLLDDKAAYDAMAHAANPYGDGKAAMRICDIIAAMEK